MIAGLSIGQILALGMGVGSRKFVYVLKSLHAPHRYYIGLTSSVGARLDDHNAGHCPHTASRRPWRLQVAVAFADEDRAVRFERFLKSASGRAFAKQHFE